MDCVHCIRRTIPPVAGAVGGAGCPAGPKRAGSGGRPRRAGGRGGGGGDPHSSLELLLVSAAVSNSSPDDDVLDDGGGGEAGGGGRCACVSAFCVVRALDLVIIDACHLCQVRVEIKIVYNCSQNWAKTRFSM